MICMRRLENRAQNGRFQASIRPGSHENVVQSPYHLLKIPFPDVHIFFLEIP